ncbi:MAG: hypothetical protein ABNG96_05945, partial [Flavobacterium sp.]
EEIINKDFSDNEKKEWLKCLNYLKIDSLRLIQLLLKQISFEESNYLKSPSLSYSNKNDGLPFINELYINSRYNKKVDTNLAILFYRISLIYQSKLNNEFLNDNYSSEQKNIILNLERNTILKGQRFGIPNELIKSEITSSRTFNRIENSELNFTKLRLSLQENQKFLSKNVDEDSYKMIFSLKKVNSKFKKVSWLGSIFELKFFINELFTQKIIIKDENYYLTIIDCFLIKGNEIEKNQLANPRGSKVNTSLLKSYISNSIIKVSRKI